MGHILVGEELGFEADKIQENSGLSGSSTNESMNLLAVREEFSTNNKTELAQANSAEGRGDEASKTQYESAYQFSDMVFRSFDSLDLDGDEDLTKLELDAVSYHLGSDNSMMSKMVSTLTTRYDDISRAVGNRTPQFNRDDAKKFHDITNPFTCSMPEPSMVSTVGKTMAGGAAGGGAVSAAQGEGFSEGAGKGAAIGAAVGLLAAGIQKAQYNELMRTRREVAGWSEFKVDSCLDDINKPAPEVSDAFVNAVRNARADIETISNRIDLLESRRRRDLDSDEVVSQFKSVGGKFDVLDLNQDGYLNVSELASGIRSFNLTEHEKNAAAVIARNIEGLSTLDVDDRITEMSRRDFASIDKIYGKATTGDKVVRTGVVGFMAGAVGCGLGALAALPTVVGSGPGCVAGASLGAGVAGWLRLRADSKPAIEFGKVHFNYKANLSRDIELLYR